MRIDYYTAGKVVTVIYATWAVIQGSVEMKASANNANSANNALNDATNKWQLANNDHAADVADIQNAKGTISGALCYMQQYPKFLGKINEYCVPAYNALNAQTVLDQKYGVQFTIKHDESATSSRVASVYVSYFCYKQSCTTDAQGYQSCTPVASTCWRWVYYTITKFTYSIHGAQLFGAGSQLSMGCGLLDQGITVAQPVEFLKSSSGVVAVDTYNEKVINYYSSYVNVDVIRDGVISTKKYELDSSSANFPQIAANILYLIELQCDALNNSLKLPGYYNELINSTITKIPGLEAEANRTQQILDAAAKYMSNKKELSDTAEQNYQQSLVIWLNVIFVPTALMILLLRCFKEVLQEKYLDSDIICVCPPLNCPTISAPLTFSSKSKMPNISFPPQEYIDPESQLELEPVGENFNNSQHREPVYLATALQHVPSGLDPRTIVEAELTKSSKALMDKEDLEFQDAEAAQDEDVSSEQFHSGNKKQLNLI